MYNLFTCNIAHIQYITQDSPNLFYQVKLTFCDEALQSIAKQALARGTGARGLRSIMVHTCTVHVIHVHVLNFFEAMI